MSEDTAALGSFLKWPGGKRWALPVLIPIVRKHLRATYFEPFLGGGAVYFSLLPPRAVLSDVNRELINAYLTVRDHPRALVSRLKGLRVSSGQYYQVRAMECGPALDRAVRFLYLNRTCFGGIYRLNSQGKFNVPFGGGGRTPAALWGRGLIRDASRALRTVELLVSDFGPAIERATDGDVVYCDPTYTVAHDQNGFIRYNEKNFSWADQERLAAAITRAVKRGATVLLSNAHHKLVRDLFEPPKRWVLSRNSQVSVSPEARRPVKEYLFLWPGGR